MPVTGWSEETTMLKRIIEWSAENRFVVLVGQLARL